MDFKALLTKIKVLITRFWHWIKPYLAELRQGLGRFWKKYHLNKIILLFMLTAILITSIYLFYVAKATNVEDLSSGLKDSTIIYDASNEEAGRFRSEKGNYVDFDEISPAVVDAVISTEDRRFYEHHGFDIKGIARAAVRMVINRNTSGGGGSTISNNSLKMRTSPSIKHLHVRLKNYF